MKIEVNVEKKHLFFLAGFIVLLLGGVFVFAQTAPNPGHSFSQVVGVAPNCNQVTSGDCDAMASGGFGTRDAVAYGSALSWNSQRLGGYAAANYCRNDGSGCPSSLSGSILGGGSNQVPPPPSGTGGAGCSAWGVASCSGPGTVSCPAGSTLRYSGDRAVGGQDLNGNSVTLFGGVYLCVKD